MQVTKKRGDFDDTPRRRSKRLAEHVRLETLHQRKIAHGRHEVGDTQEDPLFIPSDEEKEVVVLLLPKSEVSSPVNPDYVSDYLDFLVEMEAMVEEPPANTPPKPLQAATPDVSSSQTPVPTLPWTDPPSFLTPMPFSVASDSPVKAAPPT